jgi:hypothetical protein
MDKWIKQTVAQGRAVNTWRLINTWKNVPHPSPQIKCKSKQHWDSIPPQSEWQSSKEQTTNIERMRGKRGQINIVGGNVN